MVSWTLAQWTKVQLRQLALATQTRRIELPYDPGGLMHRVLAVMRAIANGRTGATNSMNRNTLRFVSLIAIALTGCSEAAIPRQPGCALMTAQICSRAAKAQLRGGALTVGAAFRPEEARVFPFVVPVRRQDGVLAAEVDCYANTDSHSYSIVRSELAIPPASQESVDYLRDRHLCADEGSYAEGEHVRVETASARPVVSR
jgi:hypothetical protein